MKLEADDGRKLLRIDKKGRPIYEAWPADLNGQIVRAQDGHVYLILPTGWRRLKEMEGETNEETGNS